MNGTRRLGLLVCPALLCLCVARMWLMPLPSSFWVDEMVTAFVAEHPGDASLAVAPQVSASIYYWLPRFMERLFGLSEIAYRVPSVLVMGIALILIARLAMRLIHPRAGWFAAFACLSLSGINFHAIDARPYGLGICVAAASLYCLVRWLDTARHRDALLFILFAALLWRVHLIYWPFYLVLAFYALARLAARETAVSWASAAAVFLLLGVALAPVAVQAIAVMREAGAHVIAEIPSFRAFEHALRWNVVLLCGAAAWLAGRLLRWRSGAKPLSASSAALIAGWWLCQPVSLFAFSHLTGDSVFIGRYLSVALPGVALAATAAAALFVPPPQWKAASIALAVVALALMGQWQTVWPWHGNSDWRAAARYINHVAAGANQTAAGAPVICPSPFIEARTPVWRPDYSLPGFLYAHLPVYPLQSHVYLFPFENSPEAERYAASLTTDTLAANRSFVIYGGAGNVRFWRKWFTARPELAAWQSHLHQFGDVWVVEFKRRD